jgi:hypothetical protein
MSRTYTLCLDTRTRSEGEIWNPTFQLSKPISRIKSACIRCVQFGNTLYNIKQGENVLSMLSGSSVVLPPGFYRADELIIKLRLVVDVTYDSTTGLLTWNIQSDSINFVHTTLQEILGLNGQVSTGQLQALWTLISYHHSSWTLPVPLFMVIDRVTITSHL